MGGKEEYVLILASQPSQPPWPASMYMFTLGRFSCLSAYATPSRYPEAEAWQAAKLLLVTKLGRESGSMIRAKAMFGYFLMIATMATMEFRVSGEIYIRQVMVSTHDQCTASCKCWFRQRQVHRWMLWQRSRDQANRKWLVRESGCMGYPWWCRQASWSCHAYHWIVCQYPLH